MQPHTAGALIGFEIAGNGIGDHHIQLSERIALGRDSTSARSIPARYVTAADGAWINLKDDFGAIAHTRKIRGLEAGVNHRTSQAYPYSDIIPIVPSPFTTNSGHPVSGNFVGRGFSAKTDRAPPW
jgi:hypothetical protein